jgi:egghead protein (zeste-white 4 protein)
LLVTYRRKTSTGKSTPKLILVNPYHIKEPRRDWTYGPFTGHRVLVTTYLISFIWALYMFQNFVWPNPQVPSTPFDIVWSYGTYLWLGAVIPGTLGLFGEYYFKHPTTLDEERPIKTLVSWRIVSRGENREILLETIRRCQKEMRASPLFPYIIEVVVDTADLVVPEPNNDVNIIRVPMEYRTPNGTRFKARGLHYAMKHSTLPRNAWIVHLDEETQPTSSGVKGICRHVRQQEESKEYRIGQGAILYHRDWKKHPFLTLADNVRTGDDFARFHFQHQLGITVFGLHGSYLVARNSVEQDTGGFDFGPNGEITEDAWWAMISMAMGYRCAWVEGYLEEQSCQSFMDFAKQRRRWWQGLAKVAIHAPVKLRWRFCLGVNTLLWAVAPLAMFYTFAHLFWGFRVEPWVRFGANYSFASFLILYLIGLKANLDEKGITNWFIRTKWWLLQVILLPVFSFMESISVFWALLKPAKGFHVIKK